MPENDPCESVVTILARQHDALGELLRKLHDGRWWPDDPTGNVDASEALVHAHHIEDSVREIARIVASLKD